MYYPITAARDVLYYGILPPADIWGIGFAFAVGIAFVGLLVFVSNQAKFIYYA